MTDSTTRTNGLDWVLRAERTSVRLGSPPSEDFGTKSTIGILCAAKSETYGIRLREYGAERLDEEEKKDGMKGKGEGAIHVFLGVIRAS